MTFRACSPLLFPMPNVRLFKVVRMNRVESQSKAQDLPVIVDDSSVQSDTVGNSEKNKDDNDRPSDSVSERMWGTERDISKSYTDPEVET